MTVHRTAATGYDRAADAYDRARPRYPEQATSWLEARLGLQPGATVADVGAGSGQLARGLASTGATVHAVEPVAAMREKLGQIDGVVPLEGTAADLPLPEGSVDAVTVGNAFHWFATERALREMRRVLVPGGPVALLWNRRDQEQDLQRELSDLIKPYRTDEPGYASMTWRRVVEESPVFSIVEESMFDNPHQTDINGVADRILSISFVAALSSSSQANVVAEARQLAQKHAVDGKLTLRYVTDGYLLEPI